MASFRCRYCGRCFRPDPRKRGRSPQKTCGREACRRKHQRRKNVEWRKRHPGYGKSRCAKTRAWAKAYPDYWKRYRSEHPEYARRDNRRRVAAKKRARRSAKQTVISQKLVEKLLAVKEIGPERSAKQTVMARRVEALVEALVWKERAAKQSLIALGPPVVG
jgi:hypothetical protein